MKKYILVSVAILVTLFLFKSRFENAEKSLARLDTAKKTNLQAENKNGFQSTAADSSSSLNSKNSDPTRELMSLVKSEALLLNGAVPDPVLHEKHLSALAESFSVKPRPTVSPS